MILAVSHGCQGGAHFSRRQSQPDSMAGQAPVRGKNLSFSVILENQSLRQFAKPGSQHDIIFHNVVTDNRGNTLFSGGIVLITNALPNPDGSFEVSKDNLVALNGLSGNEPADIVTDAASTPNVSATGATRQYPTGCVAFSGAAPSTSPRKTLH